MMRAVAVVLAFACAACAFAAEQPKDFAYGLTISGPPGDAFYQLELPAAVYAKITRADVGDLRVFNAAGEVVPHAFPPPVSDERQQGTVVDLALFPLHGDVARGVDGVNVRVDTQSGRTSIRVVTGADAPSARAPLLGYVLDASSIAQPLVSLTLAWSDATPSIVTKVSLEASDDLIAWRSVASEVPIVRLEAAGVPGQARIGQNDINFTPTRAKFWRLAWRGKPIELSGVQGRAGATTIEAPRQWREIASVAVADAPGDYQIDAQGAFPVDRVRILLPQQNTVVGVRVLTRSQPKDAWHEVASTTAYRLLRDGVEVTSPAIPIALTADRYWLIRVDQRGGGLGSQPPTLAQGWRPRTIVFAARGEAPFQVAFGSRTAGPMALPIASLVPDWKSDQVATLKRASIVSPAADSTASKDPAPTPQTLGGEAALAKTPDYKTWALWAILVTAVLVLGVMALRLVKRMGSGGTERS